MDPNSTTTGKIYTAYYAISWIIPSSAYSFPYAEKDR